MTDPRDALVAELTEALRPFAAFADHQRSWPVTPGSSLAKRQLTMGDCYAAAGLLARTALNASSEERHG